VCAVGRVGSGVGFALHKLSVCVCACVAEMSGISGACISICDSSHEYCTPMLSYTCSFQSSVVVRRVASYHSIIWWICVVFAVALLLEGVVPYLT
jgi:hypothetical protein